MNNSIKKYSNLLTTFVEDIFLPLVDFRVPQVARAIEQWDQLKSLITQVCETECGEASLNKMQRYLIENCSKPNLGSVTKTINVSSTNNLLNTSSPKQYVNTNLNSNVSSNSNSNSKENGSGDKHKVETKAPLYENDPRRYNLGEGPSSSSRKLEYGEQKKDKKTGTLVSDKSNPISQNPGLGQAWDQQKEKATKHNIEILQNLVSSFKKLSANVENNHKRLVFERENISF